MEVQELVQRAEKLERELRSLPGGTVVYKNIRGKRQPYLQWAEQGKTKSRYLKQEERERVIAEVAKRKQAQAELREIRLQLQNQTPRHSMGYYPSLSFREKAYQEYYPWRTNVMRGEALIHQMRQVGSYGKRDCYRQLNRFLTEEMNGRVCLLYGLRRTGKTTMLFQAMNDLSPEERAKCVYIKARPTDSMADVDADLQALWKQGARYIFLDEVTLLKDFIDGAALFSDVYAIMGMKIVLSGTDSLGFWFTQTQELYDRTFTIHTTYIPFQEYSRLLGVNDLDEYIRYGGTLRRGELAFEDPDALAFDAAFRDDESTRKYIDTAICNNIQHSLACCRDGRYFRHLRDLYEAGELTSAIQRIIESMNHRFLLSVLTRPFKSHDLGSAAELLRKQGDITRRTLILDQIDREAIAQKLMDLLQIRNQEDLKVGLTPAHVKEIREYLQALDLVMDCPAHSLAGEQAEYILFTQPGMRYCQAEALVYVLMNDESFLSFPPVEREIACEKILEEVRGRMMEDIVLMETARALPRGTEAFKLTSARGELDMVIHARGSQKCEAYEIKHSDQIVPMQYHALEDEAFCAETARQYGEIGKKCVIYKGESRMLDNGVEYVNVEAYLNNMNRLTIN